MLNPLLSLLTADPSGENPITLEEISNIPSLPEVDPAVAAIYYITGDKKVPLLRRLEH